MVNANLSEFERKHDVNHQYIKKPKKDVKLSIEELADN